jgi:hypothetical protein
MFIRAMTRTERDPVDTSIDDELPRLRLQATVTILKDRGLYIYSHACSKPK